VTGLNLRSATLSYDAVSGAYTFTFPSWPVNHQPPLNAAPSAVPCQAGTYDLWFFASKAVTVTDSKGRSSVVRDVADSPLIGVKFLVDQPVQSRQVVTTAACNGCHRKLQTHGGSRQNAQGCSACHSAGAQDKVVGSTTSQSCQVDSNCQGYASGWENCAITPGNLTGTCTVILDPTPGLSIDLPGFIHALHFARLRAGYLERNWSTPGRFEVYTSTSGLVDYGAGLISTDARSCTQCHADTGTSCTSNLGCGFGQRCTGGTCQNVSWKRASSGACLGCHDSGGDFGHVALQTWDPGGGAEPIETCEVCHGEGAQASVEAVHAIANPYKPPLPREP
jgi:OmcA/MtrC family decaheme c-type cytochrome